MVTTNLVWEKLKEVYDPELNFSVVDLGLIYNVEVSDSLSRAGQDVKVAMTLTTPFCPYGPALLDEMKQQISKIKGVGKIDITVVWEPPWDTGKLSPEIKAQLGMV